MFLVLILGVAFCFLTLCFYNKESRFIKVWINGIMLWCELLFVNVEILSIFSALNRRNVFCFWCVVCITALFILLKSGKYKESFCFLRKMKDVVKHNKALSVIMLCVVFLSLFTVPYNWDSMSYHLPRITNWIQNQSVSHYATHNVRQVANPPFHEFICLEVYMLSKNRDIFLNLVQGFSFLTNMCMVFEIARKLGCSDKFCKVGALLFCSTPIAFGEALTTQNDNLACLFLLIFVYYLLDFIRPDRAKIKNTKETFYASYIMGGAVGFGFITKPTVSMGMAFLAIILLIYCIRRRDSVKIILKLIVTALPVILLLIMPHLLRNLKTFGALFPSGTGARQLVGTLNPRYLLINGLKNFSFNFPNIYIPFSKGTCESLIRSIASLIGVDINDASIAEDGRIFSLGGNGEYGHDTAISFIIFILSIFCFVWCLYRRKNAKKEQKQYTYIVMALFSLICIFIRWEPFVSRYMLPYLALMCPMAAIWAEDIEQNAKRGWVRGSSTGVICTLAVLELCMLFSYHVKIAYRQHISRPEGYFQNNSAVREEFITACDEVKETGAKNIGLMTSGDSYEYTVWYMLKHNVNQIKHINVENDTIQYEDLDFVPDCIISRKDLGDNIETRGQQYKKIRAGEFINVYEIQEKESAN